MRYLKKYENHEDIHQRCREYGILDYTINDDGSIDVDDAYVECENITRIPIKFRNVSNHFSCVDNKLTSLVGSPISVGGDFYCSFNKLTNLDGCPKSVGGSFSCRENKITSLKGCPKLVGGIFDCRVNKIDTFEGLDFIHIEYTFHCDNNPIYEVWRLFWDHTKFEFFNDCDIIREDRVIILERLNFFLDYINKPTVTEVKGYKCI